MPLATLNSHFPLSLCILHMWRTAKQGGAAYASPTVFMPLVSRKVGTPCLRTFGQGSVSLLCFFFFKTVSQFNGSLGREWSLRIYTILNLVEICNILNSCFDKAWVRGNPSGHTNNSYPKAVFLQEPGLHINNWHRATGSEKCRGTEATGDGIFCSSPLWWEDIVQTTGWSPEQASSTSQFLRFKTWMTCK